MDKLGLLFWCLSNSVFLVVQADIPVNNTEPALLNYLFQNYSKDARPVLNVDDPVQLKLGIMLRQVIDLDEREQILTTNVWIRQYWADHFLQWNPDDFSGIKSIIIAPDKVWKPDVLLFNQ